MPHIDHGIPWLDEDVLLELVDRVASVMCDASEKPFAENIRITAEYVERVRGRVVVEGAVDEIYAADGAGGMKNEPTTVEQAVKFLRETGVDILVPQRGHGAPHDRRSRRPTDPTGRARSAPPSGASSASMAPLRRGQRISRSCPATASSR